jgi:hypothetical protein
MKALRSKLAPPHGVVDFPYMYLVKTLKKSSFKKSKELELRY